VTKSERDVAAKRARYAADPGVKERDAQRRRERQRERYENDPEFRARRIAYTMKQKRFTNRGITPGIYNRMLEAQDNKCGGCLKDVDQKTGYIDHNHDTGKVRGILCHACNISVHRHATPEVLRRLADYVERN
jgi:hypothetical protein